MGIKTKVLIQNILLVENPKFQKIGQDLEYYEKTLNRWILCKLSNITYKYEIIIFDDKRTIELPLNTIKLRPLNSLEQINTEFHIEYKPCLVPESEYDLFHCNHFCNCSQLFEMDYDLYNLSPQEIKNSLIK